ncbi:hypothetical protein NM688_g942 [Phlebia brevispora]|uniref:Uncharacterized protein n=1 Tax=Phlebia brevispora TaxID=194682 RepID=A0ACC1TD77_9APHY|nr:hypothetical protein NM688_g942 [Phlebia brevispora]
MSNKQRLVLSIIDFLNQSIRDGTVKQDDQESLEVAIQCIGEAFEVDPTDDAQRERLSVKPASLQSIFDVYLKTREKMGSPGAGSSSTAPSESTSSSVPASSGPKVPSAEDKAAAEKLKASGNSHMSAKSYDAAIESYTQAIQLDPTNAVYYSNRAAAYSSKGEHGSAVADAEKAIEVDPSFVRAYHRLGHAHYCLNDYKEAADAFRRGLELDSSNANLKQGLQMAEARIPKDEESDEIPSTDSAAAGAPGGLPDLAGLMNNPMMMQMAQQLMQNGGMEQLMSNPSVQNMMNRVQSGGGMPSMAELMSDPTMRNLTAVSFASLRLHTTALASVRCILAATLIISLILHSAFIFTGLWSLHSSIAFVPILVIILNAREIEFECSALNLFIPRLSAGTRQEVQEQIQASDNSCFPASVYSMGCDLKHRAFLDRCSRMTCLKTPPHCAGITFATVDSHPLLNMNALALALLVSLFIFLWKILPSWRRRNMLKASMPPSPRGIPFLGNALQVPFVEVWRTFTKWQEELGPVFLLNIVGKHVVVLNTLEAAIDLLDHRSGIYSDRPRMIVASEIICDDNHLALMGYGPKWRRLRRIAHDILNTHGVQAYRQHQEHDAAILVGNLLESPQNWDRHFRLAAASNSYSVMYGEHLSGKEAYSKVERNIETVHVVTVAVAPATAPYVEFFPVLQYLPKWFPGAGWKRQAFEHQHKITSMYKELLNDVRAKVENGIARPSLASSMIEKQGKYGLSEEEIAWLPGIIYLTGAETTGGTLFVFLLAMVLFPDVLKRAQAEVDAVVSRERMPSFEDQRNLPYIEAMVKEVLRWFPGVPLGLPRRCMTDDWYGDYLVPQGATLLPNVWAITRDTKYFPDPENLMPERFLGKKGEVSKVLEMVVEMNFVFGFGRRICPGKTYANNSMFIMFATLVWAFDIHKAKDDAGNEITPDSTACVDEGVVVRPAVFPCEIVPRHPMLLRNLQAKAPVSYLWQMNYMQSGGGMLSMADLTLSYIAIRYECGSMSMTWRLRNLRRLGIAMPLSAACGKRIILRLVHSVWLSSPVAARICIARSVICCEELLRAFASPPWRSGKIFIAEMPSTEAFYGVQRSLTWLKLESLTNHTQSRLEPDCDQLSALSPRVQRTARRHSRAGLMTALSIFAWVLILVSSLKVEGRARTNLFTEHGRKPCYLNMLEGVTDLLDRSSIYSNRPWYGSEWRRMRQAAHETLHAHVIHSEALNRAQAEVDTIAMTGMDTISFQRSIRAMTQDPRHSIPDRDKFMPERFLVEDANNSKTLTATTLERSFVFDYGRRSSARSREMTSRISEEGRSHSSLLLPNLSADGIAYDVFSPIEPLPAGLSKSAHTSIRYNVADSDTMGSVASATMTASSIFLDMSALSIASLIFFLISFLKLVSAWSRKCLIRTQMPPSPRGLPLLGNVLQVPFVETWRVFTKWKEELDHRSSIYSDRPRMIVAGEIICDGRHLALVGYGPKWRRMRRAAHDTLHARAVQVYEEHQEHDAAILVGNLCESPQRWDRHFRHTAASSSFSAIYGKHLASKESYTIVERSLETVYAIATAGAPATASYVEFFPIFPTIPPWFPGAGWKRKGLKHREKFTSMFKELLRHVSVDMENGTARPSLASSILEKHDKYSLTDTELAWLPGMIYMTGAETTGGALFVFLLAMVLYPEVLKRAQFEVDTVVGRERMPSFGDKNNLSYIEALVKDFGGAAMATWRTVRTPKVIYRGDPRCFAHATGNDDVLISSGRLVRELFHPERAMTRDPRHFLDPDRFMPERFLAEDTKHSRLLTSALEMNFVFGYGRRICPGKAYSLNGLFIMFATLVWAFDIRKAKDDAGNDITPDSTACVDEGLVVRPAVFPCEIVPRHPMVHSLVDKAKACAVSGH